MQSIEKNDLDLTVLPFKLLYLVGQNIFGSWKIWTFLYCFIVSACFILCLLEPVLHYEGPETLAGAIEVDGPSHQFLVKILVYKWYQKDFVNLITEQRNFWSIDMEGAKLEEEITLAFTKVKSGFKIFLLSSAVAETLMALKPLIPLLVRRNKNNRKMLVDSWYRLVREEIEKLKDPNNSNHTDAFELVTSGDRELPIKLYNFIDLNQNPIYQIAYLISVVYLYIIICFVVGFDGLFLAICAGAAGQLVLLKSAMARLEPSTCKEKIPIYVKHHNFILEYIKKLRRIFSILLLNQFLSSVLCVCMAIYLSTSEGVTDLVFTLRCGIFALAGVIQIFIYCYIGTTIKDQLDSVADAICSCNWTHNYEKDLRQAVLMITYSAQNTRSFKAGGMIDLNLQSFVAVLRMSFSFFTLMQSSNAQK